MLDSTSQEEPPKPYFWQQSSGLNFASKKNPRAIWKAEKKQKLLIAQHIKEILGRE